VGPRTAILLATIVVLNLWLSWLGMMAVHELGHVLHAWLSGAVVARVVLGPFEMSRTDLWRNPHPLFVAAGEPRLFLAP
jgi:hypothetical protein